MPYFINVGQFKQLKGGMGARGWHIWRRKNIVHVRISWMFFGTANCF